MEENNKSAIDSATLIKQQLELIDQKGRELGNHFGYGCDTREALDRWRRSF